MSGSDKLSPRYVVICVADEPSCLDALVRDVGRVCRPEFDVEACSDPQRVLEIADALRPPHERVALVIADHHMPTLSGVELLLALHDKHNGHATRKVLLDADVSREDLIRLLGHGALHRTLSNPWTPEALQECLTSLLTSYLSHHAPEDMPRFSRLVDLEQRPRAQKEADQTRKTLSLQVRTLESSFLANMDMSDEEVERAMGAGIDEALDSPPRRDHPAGSVLLRQDQPVESVSIVVSGEVQLLRRAGEHEVAVSRVPDLVVQHFAEHGECGEPGYERQSAGEERYRWHVFEAEGREAPRQEALREHGRGQGSRTTLTAAP